MYKGKDYNGKSRTCDVFGERRRKHKEDGGVKKNELRECGGEDGDVLCGSVVWLVCTVKAGKRGGGGGGEKVWV